MRPEIEALAHRLLDELADDGGAELIEAYCYRLPVLVICRLLGVPGEDHDEFATWVPDVVAGLDASAVVSRGVRDRADAAAVRLTAYFGRLIERRRADPADDLLSALIAAADGEDSLSGSELIAFAALLLIAGHETTANLMGNGLWALWRNADSVPSLAHRARAADERGRGAAALRQPRPARPAHPARAHRGGWGRDRRWSLRHGPAGRRQPRPVALR